MTRRDFVLIAGVIKALDTEGVITRAPPPNWRVGNTRELIVEAFADQLVTTNPGFKRDVFIKVCQP